MPRFKAVLLLLLLAFAPVVAATPVLAVKPDEVLSDPALEARARALSAHLRCMVCQNQSIDDSDAELARDLRVLVRERLVAGDSDGEVIDYLVSRYGEFVLLKPRFSWQNLALWATPAVVLIIGAAAFAAYSRRRAAPAGKATTALTDDEQARIEKLLDEH
ncbi:MAG TPA: cytochrome c-type biogenesis protein [Rhizobiaceae bacterium]|nr:cytochrome c-type biogenesis protein [Rhizobiaceae bacterium]